MDLLIGWEAVRPSAVEVLLVMESRAHNALDPLSSDSLTLGEVTCRYLLEVDRLRWIQLTNAEKLVNDASNALDEFDNAIRRTCTRLQGSGTMPDAELLGNLEERARRLGSLFSSLTLCHDSILATDEYV
ncbi:hypothetical protein [Zoogloea sp.]|uniref:hypothetical protein n=1 Tax=Zoogloea sp. TaxID=49181 RepID=UPI002612FFA6|nr:hypothetical protein [Zoogloea sp.]